ncbi:MAG TPA: CHASE3 domain-containing protein [Candidatus Angelobacter sp.]|nr:CHASE3 domain-containing protein [Candidatus Angelobacter sp.]
MQHIYKRFSVIAGFTALLAVLLISTAITRRRVDVLERNQSWVEHTQQVLLELSTVESLLKDAETGQRGFLYTGEESYLEPYNAAIKLVGAHVDKLAELTADNPRQQARMPMLRRLTQQKLDELARTIAMFNQGDPEQTKSLVRSDLGKLIMDNIRALADEMRQEEDSLETARLQSAASSTQALILTLYLNTGAAMAGLVLLAFFILREMAQREKHAAEIREREEWFRVTLGSIGDAVIATDERGTVIFVNPIAEELLGVKLREAQGQAIQKIFPIFNEQTRQPVENPVGKVLELGRVMGLANHTVLVRSDGKIIPIEDSAAPIFDDQKRLRGVVMVFRDVTLEKQSQEIMRKAEKLAAAGRLAATVAHEINNPLEAVCNLVYLATRAANVPEDVRGYLSMAEQELERVSHITRQTLGFYRDSAVPTAVEVRAVVESVIKLYANKLKSKNISLELDMVDCPPVQGMQGELKQLIANLISNAADAVGIGGRIRVSVWPAVGAEGKGVEVKVADDGPGVPEKNRPHIFEPFFTTKQDVGTGLGLWVSKEIAERHHGRVELSSKSQDGLGGAIFTVFLPCEVHAEAAEGAA